MLVAGFTGNQLFAQKPEEKRPLVESVTFKGVNSVSESELARTLATQPTRCRVFLLKPLCVLTHNHLFEMRNKLDREELGRDVLRVAVFYWLRGFRHVHVDTTVTPKGRGVAVTFKVTEGKPTLIENVTLVQPRPLISERALHRWGLPRKGDRIDLTRLDSMETRARRALWDRGYGNAEVRDTAILVDSFHVALNVLVDAGPRTTIDTVLVEGNEKVSSRTVRRLVGLRHGDLYKRTDLLEAQRRLYRSDLFRSTMLSVADSADSAKTVKVTVREAPLHGTQLGAGFNTVEFAQVQANLTLYNFHGSARRVELHSVVGNLFAGTLCCSGVFRSASPDINGEPDAAFLRPTYQLTASMTQPWLFSTRNSIGITAFYNRRSVPNIVVDHGAGGSLTFTRTLAPEMPLSFTYRLERTQIEAGEVYFCVNFGYCSIPEIVALQRWNSLSPFIVTLRADRVDDPLAPRTGYTAFVGLEHAAQWTASDWHYDRAEIDITPYLKMGRNTLVVRGHAGRLWPQRGTNEALGIPLGDGELVHPRVRFYAGGARSVRGYAEGQLGPRVLTIDPQKLIEPSNVNRGEACTVVTIDDLTCDPNVAPSSEFTPRPVGGNTLIAGTIEYRFPLSRNTGGAVFVDAGRVGSGSLGRERLLRSRSAVTPGVGFRYLSPIGPVRVDLALRPNRTEDLPVVTQRLAADSVTLELVELLTPKRFNPSEGASGFFGKMFSRMQLHLYIGEAF